MTSIFGHIRNDSCSLQLTSPLMFSRASSKCTRVSRLSCRRLATEAAKPAEASSSLAAQAARPKTTTKHKISTAIILNRSPILTRAPTAFEEAYYSYQARIRRALHNPFPHDFYFKQGTLVETRFRLEERSREQHAFGEKFVPKEEDVSEEKRAADQAAVDQLAQQEGEGEVLMPRTHPADTAGDVKSLDRAGERNLYLLLKTSEGGKTVWRFPQGGIEKGQLLHQAAQKDLEAECGDQMDTWVVGKAPIGVHTLPSETPEQENVLFFYKAHIMSGQVHPEGKHIQDFAWLTKEEISTKVEPTYWDSVRDILSDF
ncbi:hypothetical protein D9619_005685 [Psilocybe cf. subviscida]|uniref:Large ribosomal subunit protein mL46 n=1 Tax=Psilocybe cf. subviscida TaxID=2480587 RepID=A0A8H5BWZ2_9AGAR|nr:hypothetical protein D9619_005685 [Psilocybe cf. subviscida]